ncbi:MAG TPA: LLM class flavin-dependent oxidoreductase [Acidimicrobiales bacterium]|nr:LLM class flavin-dependent oxidoreductase [Acidimicrobiales bacterium]
MPLVPPVAERGSVGLILPPRLPSDLPGSSGSTSGKNRGSTIGTTEELQRTCRDAEALGASALWAVDHLFWATPMLECLTTLTVAATATTRAMLGSCVLQLPLRQPAAVAKQAAAIQLLSGGRFVLGVGVGRHRGEYEMAGVDFSRRGRLLDDGLAELRRAWDSAGDAAVPYRQEPAAPPVPVWVGGSSDAARRRAATSADGWVPLFLAPTELASSLEQLRAEVAAAGRPAAAVTPAVVVMVAVGRERKVHERGTRWLSSLYGIPPKAFDRHLVAGPAEHCASRLDEYVDAGAEHVVVMVADDRPLDHFAELVGALRPAVPPGPAGDGVVRPDLADPVRPDLVEVGV